MKFFFLILLISSFANAKQTIYEDLKVEGVASANRVEAIISSNPCPSYSQASIDTLAAVAGDCVFNTTTQNLNIFDGTIWKSAGGGLSKWEEGKVFNLDDVVVYDNAIYRCVSAHTSSLPFEEVKWELISGDTVLNGARVKNIVAEKVIQIANDSFKIETDTDNLFTNGDFQAQNVMLGWQKGPGAGVGIHTTAPFVGNQSLSLQFVGSDADFWRDVTRPEYVGRMARITLYYKSSATWATDIPQICTYIGSTSNISSCSIIKNTGGQWGLYQSPNFYWSDPKVGLIIKSNGKIDLVNEVLLGRARLELDKNEGFVANIVGDKQQVVLTTNAGIAVSTNLDALSKSFEVNSSSIFTLSASGITLLRDADISVVLSSFSSNNTVIGSVIRVNGTIIPWALSLRPTTGQVGAVASLKLELKKNDVITLETSASLTSANVQISATARSQVTVYPDETFSTDINPVFWKATACGEDEIGCYNTYYYPTASSNAKTLCATRPTQADSDMRVNGIQLQTLAYNVASSCAIPSVIDLVVGSEMSTPTASFYKDTARSATGTIGSIVAYGNQKYGAISNYNAKKGTYFFDAKFDRSGQSTSPNASFIFSDGSSSQNNGYLVIKASKTGLGMANVPARTLVKIVEGSGYVVKIYSDGWTEHRYTLPGAGSWTAVTIRVALRDTSFAPLIASTNPLTDDAVMTWAVARHSSTTEFRYVSGFQNAGTQTKFAYPTSVFLEGYGASSVVKQYGAKPAY